MSLRPYWPEIHRSASYRQLRLCPLSASLLCLFTPSSSVHHIIIISLFHSLSTPPVRSHAAAGSWGLFSKSSEQPTHSHFFTPQLLTPAEPKGCQLTILFLQCICLLWLYVACCYIIQGPSRAVLCGLKGPDLLPWANKQFICLFCPLFCVANTCQWFNYLLY